MKISGGLLRQHSDLVYQLHRFVDMILVTVAFTLASVTRNLFWPPLNSDELIAQPNHYLVLIIFLGCLYTSLNLFRVYRSYRNIRYYSVFFRVLQGVLAGTTVSVFLLYLINERDVSRLLILLFIGYTVILLAICKAFLYYALLHYRRKDYNFRNVLIIGTQERAREMVRAIINNPGSGFRILGCLDLIGQENRTGSTVYRNVKTLGTLADYQDILLDKTIDEIVFAVPLKIIDNVTEYIRVAERLGINIRIMPDFQIQKVMYRPETASIYLERFVGMPTIALSSLPEGGAELFVKEVIDYVGAVLGLILTLPLLLLIGLSIKMTSRGPVIFKQERCGLNGRKFTLYKFRTMVEGAEELRNNLETVNEMDGPVFKIKEDPRTTRVGRFLRKTSLDELPQLFNILKGEMSFVGPRPPIPREVKEYKLWQRRRLSMKPGLTCIWQVSGRNNIDFEQWMRLDLQYIDNWSIWLDLKLIMLTCKEILMGNGR